MGNLLEVPTLHRVLDAAGKKRLIMFSGLYPIRMAVSADDGATWSELKSIGDFGGVVTMGTVISLQPPGHYLAFFTMMAASSAAEASRPTPWPARTAITFPQPRRLGVTGFTPPYLKMAA